MSYVLLQQFNNPANPAIHESTTGPEIWNDTDGAIDILVSGVGTGGTITGVSRYIKKIKGKKITVGRGRTRREPGADAAARAVSRSSRRRIRFKASAPALSRRSSTSSLVDEVEQVTNEEAIHYARRLTREEGILSGISGARRWRWRSRIAKRPQHAGKTIVAILPDSGERYLSTTLFEGVFDR